MFLLPSWVFLLKDFILPAAQLLFIIWELYIFYLSLCFRQRCFRNIILVWIPNSEHFKKTCLRTHTGLQHQAIRSPSALGFWAAASSGRAQGRYSHRAAQQCLILCVDPDIRMFTVCIRLLPVLKSSAKPNQLTTCQPSDGYIELCLLAFLCCLGRFDLVALTNHTNSPDSTSRHSLHESRGFQGNTRPLLEKTVGSCLGAE